MKIKEARKEKKLSQEDIARELNISLVSYCMKEKGRSKWKFEEAKKFCIITETKMDEIEDFQ